MPAARFPATIVATALLAAGPALAADPAPGTGPLCSPTVSAALTTWDMGLQAAGKFGDKAVTIARDKGREYILPLLGIDPKAAQPGTDDGTRVIGRLLESTRQDPHQRLELCVAITEAVELAKGSATSGMEALKRALDRFAPTAPVETPVDSLIRI